MYHCASRVRASLNEATPRTRTLRGGLPASPCAFLSLSFLAFRFFFAPLLLAYCDDRKPWLPSFFFSVCVFDSSRGLPLDLAALPCAFERAFLLLFFLVHIQPSPSYSFSINSHVCRMPCPRCLPLLSPFSGCSETPRCSLSARCKREAVVLCVVFYVCCAIFSLRPFPFLLFALLPLVLLLPLVSPSTLPHGRTLVNEAVFSFFFAVLFA